MLTLPTTGPYAAKDQRKANLADKFIGRGSARSSTQKYADALGDAANPGVYEPGDIVFVSAEGNRAGRLTPDFAEIRRAADAGVTFITDPLGQGQNGTRTSPYNQGEREVAAELNRLGYQEGAGGTGLWTPWTPEGTSPTTGGQR